ncbi:hypothetical protein DP939_27245 [Spongiactinospora rosea]|uniref:TPM domain-containing protein n=1 Tax=Spongiactinospora rosea TaxID=2248750 RepID=A0A366LUB4_9ACTN|nr:hypothetical protein [Spongiactinospora rosea]RBQ17170.1 hypothetical protein DP939_27245 [Spongiactinospora rosea]
MTQPARRAGTALAALLAGLFALLAMAPAASAAAPPDAATVIASWQNTRDKLYVMSGASLTSAQQSEVRTALADSKHPIYLAAFPDGTLPNDQVKSYMTTLGQALQAEGRGAASLAVIDGQTLFATSGMVNQRTMAQIANLSATGNTGDVVNVVKDFVNRTNAAVNGDRKGALGSGSKAGTSGGVSSGVTIALLVLLLVGGGGLFLYSRKKRQQREAREAAELAAVKQTVEEDVTKFGEEITALDTDVKMLGEGGGHLNEWQEALDSYEKAKVELAAVKRPDDVRGVTSTLQDGRYALAVVKARVNQQPIPERRAPCFFNPQHGPSVRDVRWAPAGGAVRDVPACAADAQAVESGFDPQMREVMVNGQRRPYYDAGPAYQPYAYGYYGGFGDVMSIMLVGTMMGSMMGGWGMGGYGMGYEQGMADAGGDMGGMGGGDWGGGGDGGGFGDFGGGDFGGDW